MAEWELTLTGGKELTRTLRSLPEALTQAVLRDALTAAAQPMARRMAMLAPRGPHAPHLADAIAVSPAKGDAESATVLVGPTREFFYGMFWEFGWKYHAARPFMRPAFDEEAEPALVILGQALWRAIDAAARAGVAGLPEAA